MTAERPARSSTPQSPANGAPGVAPPRPLRLGKRIAWLVALLLLLPWGVIVLVVRQSDRGRLTEAKLLDRATVRTEAAAARTFMLAPGPWGRVEATRIALEVPAEFIFTDRDGGEAAEWVFVGFTRAQVVALFQSAQLTPAQSELLIDHSNWTVGSEGVRVHPAPELVLGLGPESRRIIYSVLGRFWENQSHRLAFVFKPELLAERFEGSGIPADVEKQIRSLLYPQGRFRMFADLYPLLATIPSAATRATVAKVSSRQWTYLLRLKVGPEDDVTKLAAFWGSGRRAKDVRPLLDSLQRVPGGTELDVSHLMPQFARRRIYTFPLPHGDGIELRRDCHWTAHNFFSETPAPDDRFTDAQFVRDVFLRDYVGVTESPLMGDLVVLFNPAGEVLHSATYIAGDMVFCKNGAHFSQPWMFMRLADMMDYYTAVYQPDHEIIPRLFRRKAG